MNREELIHQIKKKKSVLCVGLDTDLQKIPYHFAKNTQSILDFNKKVIDATKDLAVSYKLNTAFYESHGSEGWKVMQETLDYIPEDIFTIADAKRGDIGNTAEKYAQAFLGNMNFHSVTVNPYMGMETIEPYTSYSGKWAIVLGLTSNKGSEDIELQTLTSEKRVYEHCLDLCTEKFSDDKLMIVVGATQSEELLNLRKKYPSYFFLIPGVGTQGGNLEEILSKTLHPEDGAILINVSRGILYSTPSSEEDWLSAIRRSAQEYQLIMNRYF